MSDLETNMTHDELRIEVARCLGWTISTAEVGYDAAAEFRRIPDYPNDPGAVARDVLPEIERHEWLLNIQMDGTYTVEIIQPEKRGYVGHAICKTFAEAVCRAFVAAVKADGKQPEPRPMTGFDIENLCDADD